MRIVAWNIRAGGGRRADAIARQLARWAADVVALCEFRATPPSVRLAAALADHGLVHQMTTAGSGPARANCLLLAARWPLRRVRVRGAPADRARWLLARIAAPRPVVVGAMHVPNRVSGRKYVFHDAVLGCAGQWRLGPAVLIGDTNSGRRGLDEQTAVFSAKEEGWIDGLARCGWIDAFRALRPAQRVYTWYSPNGRNGFRIDQAFVNRALQPRVRDVVYAWGRTRGSGREALSDHAALLLDLDPVAP
jgi:exonuclease III